MEIRTVPDMQGRIIIRPCTTPAIRTCIRKYVTPAKAGVQTEDEQRQRMLRKQIYAVWIPACAGMTGTETTLLFPVT
jgi:hypothetical protein